MTQNITLTPAQLTFAQMGKKVTLDTDYVIEAIKLNGDVYKYIVSWHGQVGMVRYISGGVEEVNYWLNASETEYDEYMTP